MVSTVTEEHREPVDCSPEAHFVAHTAKMSMPRRDTVDLVGRTKAMWLGGAKRTEGGGTSLAPPDDR